ncbi:unnamed protein product [Caenorhabditis auriculariae]|uniref:TBC domain-containing protein kinase-like protein n=1 Tax=Caenorhabditis auriculariae TaxID=2777116 RepID=A0A8S1GWK3_9PELO|nr:unnamed protein product [Caenorhabditis auriculariae]
MRKLENAKFGAIVVRGVEEGGRTCINGLPFVSPAIRMLGRFQKLKSLKHDNLCACLDLIRCRSASNLVIVITEVHSTRLCDILNNSFSPKVIQNFGYQIADALYYLHSQNILHSNLSLSNIIVLDDGKRLRLSNYGTSFVANYGADADLSGHSTVFAFSPERFIQETSTLPSQKKTMFGPWESSYFVEDETISAILYDCLKVNPRRRHRMREMMNKLKNSDACDGKDSFVTTIPEMKETIKELHDQKSWQFTSFSIEDAYFLWRLCGATPENILLRNSVIKLKPPLTTLPSIVIEDFTIFGNEKKRQFFVASSIFIFADCNLKSKLSELSVKDLKTSLELSKLGVKSVEPDLSDVHLANLAVIVKEKDALYQAKRMSLLRHLVSAKGFNEAKDFLKSTVRQDNPPVYRNAAWSVLLDVDDSDNFLFWSLNTLQPHPSDRQLDVDIPRCHQYEEMMTSPAAHAALRRLLKAWLLTNERYVYWQGCDSLAAPFLLLNFNRPETALACLNEFIKRYLHDFFLKDNSAIIQEYLTVFNHLLAYVDAPLYSHLAELGFFPELYAIPWFLTCFAHVLPMHKLLHIWDQVLLHDSSFPLFVGLALMRQLRPKLIIASFNDAILLFSDLPDLSIEKIVSCSHRFRSIVPPSCTFRVHDGPWTEKRIANEVEPFNLNRTLIAMTVAELKEMNCPRISSPEFIWRVTQKQICVIDIRLSSEFARGCVVGSVNYPSASRKQLKSIANALKTATRQAYPICIVWGKDHKTAIKFGAMLVRIGRNYVCILDGGFESIRDERTILDVAH